MSAQQGSTGSVDRSREKESRHLWVGGLPDKIDEAGIRDYFTRYGKIEGVKILPQKYPNIGVAAFIDFYDIKSATEAKEAKHKLNGNELRTNFKTNPGENKYEGGGKSQDKEKQAERDSDSSSSGSESGSSSSSSSSESEKEVAQSKKGRKKISGSGGSGTSAPYIKVTGLASRSEQVLQDGLYYEFCRYSTDVVVKIYGEDEEKKWAVVKYKRAERCREAFKQIQGTVLFGSKIKLNLVDVDDHPQGGHDPGHDPYHHDGGKASLHPSLPPPHHPFMREDLDPSATRSLFVGNIPKNISVYELRDAFFRYGNVLDVEIKKMGGNATYGFILYYDLMSAITAKQYMDGHNLKGNNIRVGFGKGTASKQLWIDGIDPSMAESQLERVLGKHGKVIKLGIDRQRCCAMIQFDSMEEAREALTAVKGTFIKNSRRLMTDFANRDARSAFFSRIEGGDVGMPPHRGYPGPPGGGMYGSDMMGDPRLMMPPRPGGMHMMGRGGGFPHRGPPMDFYYNPFMDDFYGGGGGGGGRPPFSPPGMRRYPPGPPGARGGPYGRDGPDDYEDELLAFSRKREREKRVKRKGRESSSESGETNSDSDDGEEEMESRKKRKAAANKGREKTKKVVKKLKDRTVSDEGISNSDGEKEAEGSRIKSTRKSRDLREKLKKKTTRKKTKHVSSNEDNSEEEETRGDERPKTRRERKSADNSPTDRSRRKGQKMPPSPDPKSPPNSAKRRGREERGSVPSDPNSEVEQTSRAHEGKEHQRKENESVREERKAGEKSEVATLETAKSKSSKHLEAHPNGEGANRKEESGDDFSADLKKNRSAHSSDPRKQSSTDSADYNKKHSSADPRRRDSADVTDPRRCSMDDDHDNDGDAPTEALAGNTNVKVKTPQSPVQSSSKSSRSPMMAVESELSSGEDFKEKEIEPPKKEKSRSQKRERNEDSDDVMDRRPVSYPSHSPGQRRPMTPLDGFRTPEFPLDKAERKRRERIPHTPPLSDKFSDEDDDGRGGSRGMSRKNRKLPRRYQIEPSNEPSGVGPGRRDGVRHRDGKDSRQDRHYHNQIPSPTSPPISYSGHSRKRHYHSPPPPEARRRRGRPYSPPGGGGGGYQRRRHSRSPPGYLGGSPPLHRAKSPYASPPPHSRPRSPIPRPRPRHRHESPPFEGQRGKFSRGRVSPLSPHHRFPYSPTPPPPRGPSARSPTGRRYGRHRSASMSPQRMRINRRERSPASDYLRSSPRPSEDRYESMKRHSKRAVYSRTPSPKDKYRDTVVKEEYPDSKRRRLEEVRPKSPSGTPPPPSNKTEASNKASRQQQGHQSHSGPLSSSEQRGFKPSNPPPQHSGSAHHRQTSSADASTKPTIATQAPPKTQANPVPPPENNLMDLLRRYPVMWQGHLMLKNDAAAVQLHFLSGNVQLANSSLPQQQQPDQRTPVLRISQRMRLEKSQLEGVDRRIQVDGEHCLLLALPCGRDATDVHTQTHALKINLINYLLQKQAAGIINVPGGQGGYVLHIFPPCPFSQSHLSRVAPDLLSSASDNCHLMIVVATM